MFGNNLPPRNTPFMCLNYSHIDLARAGATQSLLGFLLRFVTNVGRRSYLARRGTWKPGRAVRYLHNATIISPTIARATQWHYYEVSSVFCLASHRANYYSFFKLDIHCGSVDQPGSGGSLHDWLQTPET